MKTMTNARLRALIEATELWVKRAAGKTRLQLVHVELAQANAFIVQHHRHHGRIPWHRFSVGASLDGRLVGVAVVGRPLGGQCQDRWVEVRRNAAGRHGCRPGGRGSRKSALTIVKADKL